jgi:phospholipid/cholesterol/gamma-HCH transport system substrate-binding protein
MSAAATHFKLGLFTLLGIAALFATAFGLGWRGVRTDTVAYHTYFDETVQGLEVGSPVKYRGVLVGNVGQIRLAPDRKHVDVTLALNVADASRLKLAKVTPEVRAQLGSQGITGVKFVDIDFFDSALNPAPILAFRPEEPYIPARPSLMKGLGDNLDIVSQRLPDLIEATVATLHKLDAILADFHDQRIPLRIAQAVGNIDGAIGDLRALLRHVDRARIPDKTATALDNLSDAVAKANAVLEGIGGDGGLVQSAQRATDSVGDLGRTTSGSAERLERTLRDLDEAAEAVRMLAEAIERDPDMLIKGRAQRSKP